MSSMLRAYGFAPHFLPTWERTWTHHVESRCFLTQIQKFDNVSKNSAQVPKKWKKKNKNTENKFLLVSYFLHVVETDTYSHSKFSCVASLVIHQSNLQTILKFITMISQLQNASFLQVMSNPHLKIIQDCWHICMNVKHVPSLWLCFPPSPDLGTNLNSSQRK